MCVFLGDFWFGFCLKKERAWSWVSGEVRRLWEDLDYLTLFKKKNIFKLGIKKYKTKHIKWSFKRRFLKLVFHTGSDLYRTFR